MRLRFLKPVNGWAGFLTELAIVVLGVLIALGAQQLIDNWQGKRDVAAFRSAVDTELAQNMRAYQKRIEQSACVASRLDQLEAWHREWQDGSGPTLTSTIGRPLAFSLNFDVWQTGSAMIVGRMPLKPRLAYAGLYSSLETYDMLRFREVAVWQTMYAYDGAVRLSGPEVNSLRGLILSARTIDRSMRINLPGLIEEAAKLGIDPSRFEGDVPMDTGLCGPLKARA